MLFHCPTSREAEPDDESICLLSLRSPKLSLPDSLIGLFTTALQMFMTQ
jgi:hypothetical protein